MASDNDRDLALFFTMVLAGVAIMAITLFFAERTFVAALDVKEVERGARWADELAAEGVLYVPLAGSPVSLDPFAPLWETAPAVDFAVTPQQVTMPALDEASIETVRVQGLTDGHIVYWRLGWADPAPDSNVDTARFTDAVALQFPITPDASYMMGEEAKRVQILHWKSLWQKDVDEHFQDVQDLHPNYWTDLYWFAEGEFPYPVPSSFDDRRSHDWFPAYQAGNPLADFHRREPVEELVAEGYGSLTHQPQSVTRGRGEWRDGRWAVILARPLRTEDPLDFQFVPGLTGQMAVAVWQGSAGNVGGRKHWSLWYDFRLQTFAVTS